MPAWCPLWQVIGYYLHDLSPFLVRFSDSMGIRWYGLAYVAGFLAGFLLLRNFCRRGYCQLHPSQVGDFITMAALLGVLLGGRIGYMLFYNLDAFLHNPAIFTSCRGAWPVMAGFSAWWSLPISLPAKKRSAGAALATTSAQSPPLDFS